jgi:L-seryl-tRNA(Ser) seleniumtransferase
LITRVPTYTPAVAPPAADAAEERAEDRRRRVPRTDRILADPRLVAAAARLGSAVVKEIVVETLGKVRAGEVRPADVVDVVLATLPIRPTSLRPVINATGVVLHTNLGRAVLSRAVLEAITAVSGATDVELDLETGRRARRGRGTLAALAGAVPAAEAVHVVNNGAAAVVLAATALAQGKEIVVSRGELVEIGDGFRLPELLASTGARLREVGTTNRTDVEDYRAAIGPDTGFVLKVHPSNFVVTGFTSSVDVHDLAGLGVLVVADIGSGLLAPDPLLPDEPDAASTLGAGAALVTASGDKLLGGPQAGLIMGKAGVVDRLRRHPLARALRVDKIILAALEATLIGPRTPTSQALHARPGALGARAEALADLLVASGVRARAVGSESVVGGGGAPGVTLPSAAVELPEDLARPLRTGDPAVLGRVERGALLLDMRTVAPDDDEAVAKAVLAAAGARDVVR